MPVPCRCSRSQAHFFDDPNICQRKAHKGLKNDSSLDAYLGAYHLENCANKIFMDATPSYLRAYDAAERMAAVMPYNLRTKHARTIVILREPIARDVSYYNMMRGEWVAQGSRGNFVVGQGHVDKHLCLKARKGFFPTYREAVLCKVEHWHEVCMRSQVLA